MAAKPVRNFGCSPLALKIRVSRPQVDSAGDDTHLGSPDAGGVENAGA